MQNTEDLFNTADVKRVRTNMIVEQGNRCAITGIPTDTKEFVLDHAHDEEQLVRGACHRQSNVMLGKIENAAKRYMYWYPHSLSQFLRECADYLEAPPDTRYRHPGWLKKAQTAFAKLKEDDKRKVLAKMNLPDGANSLYRKSMFKKALLTRNFSYSTIQKYLKV